MDKFFDKDDVLGFPLRPISDTYFHTVHADIAINVGGVVSQWNPMCHTRYWTDNDFTVPVARFIEELISEYG